MVKYREYLLYHVCVYFFFIFRPQRIEDTTPNDDEVNSNSIVTRPRVPNPSSDEQRPIFNVPIQEPEDISQNEVTDNR